MNCSNHEENLEKNLASNEMQNPWVPAYLHNRPALDHFWAIRPDSHLTISIFTWYLPLKDWNLYYVFTHLLAIWPFLSLFDPTRTRPFAICIDLYSTNLVSVHSLASIFYLFVFLKNLLNDGIIFHFSLSVTDKNVIFF